MKSVKNEKGMLFVKTKSISFMLFVYESNMLGIKRNHLQVLCLEIQIVSIKYKKFV